MSSLLEVFGDVERIFEIEVNGESVEFVFMRSEWPDSQDIEEFFLDRNPKYLGCTLSVKWSN